MDEKATCIYDLLPEVLIKIFKKLDKDTDLKNVQTVCRHWAELVDRRVGRKLRIGIARHHEFSQVELDQLSRIGAQSCYIYMDETRQGEGMGEESENEESGNEDEDEHQNEVEDQKEAESVNENDERQNPLEGGLKYPHLLKNLYLHGSLHPTVLLRLLENTRNLSYIDTTLFTFSKIRNEDLQNLKFPKLKELNIEIDGYPCENKYFGNPNATEFLPNLKTLFTKNRLPQLTRLRIELAIGSFKDLSMTDTLVTFAQEHHALQDLDVYLDMIIMSTDDIPEPEPPTYAELTRTIIAGIRRRGDCRLKVLNIAAETGDLYKTHGCPFHAPIEIIKEFLLHVVSLQSLGMMLGPIPSSTLQEICIRNAATLQDISILNDYSHVDCGIFASSRAAQSILICSMSHGAIGINELPLTLTKVHVTGPIEQTEAEHILFNLPEIQEIDLCWIPYNSSVRDGSCVTLDMLRQFNQNRKVDRLRVARHSLIDGQSFPLEGIPNNDPTNPEMLKVLISGFDHLEWKLNEAGFYTNGWNDDDESD